MNTIYIHKRDYAALAADTTATGVRLTAYAVRPKGVPTIPVTDLADVWHDNLVRPKMGVPILVTDKMGNTNQAVMDWRGADRFFVEWEDGERRAMKWQEVVEWAYISALKNPNPKGGAK